MVCASFLQLCNLYFKTTCLPPLPSPDPNPPTDVRVHSTSTTSATFTWSAPSQSANVDSYRYTITKSGAASPTIDRVVDAVYNRTHGMDSGTTYILRVYATSNNQEGEPASHTFTLGRLHSYTNRAVACRSQVRKMNITLTQELICLKHLLYMLLSVC